MPSWLQAVVFAPSDTSAAAGVYVDHDIAKRRLHLLPCATTARVTKMSFAAPSAISNVYRKTDSLKSGMHRHQIKAWNVQRRSDLAGTAPSVRTSSTILVSLRPPIKSEPLTVDGYDRDCIFWNSDSATLRWNLRLTRKVRSPLREITWSTHTYY